MLSVRSRAAPVLSSRHVLAAVVGVCVCVLAAANLAHAEQPAGPDAAWVAAARAAVKDLGDNLKTELGKALASGGPMAAVGVCQTAAPSVAEAASEAHKLRVGRTALRLRNPANAPDDFERRVLEDFVRRIEDGADPATLEHVEAVVEGGETRFRYMKAIPTAAAPCLACHGSEIAPDLKAEILRLYPGDAATGFKEGELRGAFTVIGTAQ